MDTGKRGSHNQVACISLHLHNRNAIICNGQRYRLLWYTWLLQTKKL